MSQTNENKNVEHSTTKRSTPDRNFNSYINRVLKQVHPDTGITGEALVQIHMIIKHLLNSIIDNTNALLLLNKKQTLTSREIESAVRLTLQKELARHAISEGRKAIIKYNEAEKGEKGKPIPKSVQAGLIFSVPRVKSVIQERSLVKRFGDQSSVFAAAVVEYMVAEILELSGNFAKESKKQRITPFHIATCIKNDSELQRTFRDYVHPVQLY